MEQRANAPARIAAALALLAALLAVIVVISAGGGADSESRGSGSGGAAKQEKRPRSKAKAYVVKSGDTLTSIAHKTGVPIPELIALNPEVDPQILIAGQKLKLR